MATIGRATRDAIESAQVLKQACKDAEKKALTSLIKDVLGDCFTQRQFDSVPWGKYGIYIPTIETLRRHGLVTYTQEEFDLPESAKASIADEKIVITYEDGSTTLEQESWYYNVMYTRTFRKKKVANVRSATADDITFKGRRNIYHVID